MAARGNVYTPARSSRVEPGPIGLAQMQQNLLGLLKMAARGNVYTPARSSRGESSRVESHSLDATRGLICNFRQLGSVNRAWHLLLCVGK